MRKTHALASVSLTSVALASAALGGCLLEPADSEAICGKDAILELSGFVAAPGVAVQVQSAATRSGTFSVIAIATSDTTAAFTRDGVSYYAWRVYAAVPTWAASSGQYESFVRPRSDGALLSFSSSPGYLACVEPALSAGQSFAEATAACSSSNTPLLRLTAPLEPAAVTVDGDVTVASMADAASYGCLSHVNGDVSIDADVVSASGLPDDAPITLPYLSMVAAGAGSPGDVSLRYFSSATSVPQKLPQLPLQFVAGNLSISAGNVARLELGLSELEVIAGDLSIDYDSMIVSGLPALRELSGNLRLSEKADSVSAAHLLPALADVGGNLSIEYEGWLDSVLDAVRSVGGDVALGYSFGPRTIAGQFRSLRGLVSVGGNLAISRAPFPQTMLAFPSLTHVNGSVTLGGSQFQTLNLGAEPTAAGPSLTIGSLIVRENPQLSSVAPGRIRITGAGAVVFLHNLCLANADVDAVFAELRALGWSGTGSSSSNGHDCMYP